MMASGSVAKWLLVSGRVFFSQKVDPVLSKVSAFGGEILYQTSPWFPNLPNQFGFPFRGTKKKSLGKMNGWVPQQIYGGLESHDFPKLPRKGDFLGEPSSKKYI